MFINHENDKYTVTLEVLNTSKEKESASYFFKGEGLTFEEGLNDIYNKCGYELYFSQLGVVIFSEDIAKKDLVYFFDYFTRDTDIRKDFLLLISDDIDSLLEYKSPEKVSIGESLKKIIDYNEQKNSKYKTSIFREVLNCYLNNKNYYIGKVVFDDNNLILRDTYLFHNNKLTYKIDEKVILIINLLNKVDSSFQIVVDETYEFFQYSLEPKFNKDKVVLSFSGTVRLINMENQSSSSINDIKVVISKLENYLKKYLNDAMLYAKNLDYDLYNFNYNYGLQFPSLVQKNTWKTLNIEVETEVKINEKGLIIDSLGDE